MTGPFSTIVDLTHTWGPNTPMFPGAEQPSIDVIVLNGSGVQGQAALTHFLDRKQPDSVDVAAALVRTCD